MTASTTKKSCFVACPIGEDGSAVRRRSDQVLKFIIGAALPQTEFTIVRADKMHEPGQITSQVIHKLLEDDLVVADLTDSNANVFYEVAIRQAIQKPLVLLVKRGQKIPFDLAGFRAIPYDITDLESVEAAKDALEKQARTELEKPQEQIETPISAAYQLRNLKQSTKGEALYIAHLVEDVGAVRSRVEDMDERLTRELARLVAPVSRSFAIAVDFEKSLDRILDYANFDLQSTAKTKRHYQELLESVVEDLTRLRSKVRNASGD